MSIWLQHLLVLAAVLLCVLFIARSALRALRGAASRLAGCGSCSGCATTPVKRATSAVSTERIAIIPMEMLTRKASKSNARAK